MTMDGETITQDGEIITGGAVAAPLAAMLQRAEIDQMVTTARAYPRTPSLVQRRIMEMATLDAESAEECIYALPRGGKPIRGPSIRFAEILKQAFGNCQAAARVVHVDRAEMFVEAEGVFVDYETNARSTARVRRRISDKKGKVLSDDMIIVTGNAACSIAMRNAILTGIPKPLWRRAYEAVEGTIAGDVMTLSQRRDNAMKAAAMYGVTPEQVYAALGVIGSDDLTTDHFLTLKGLIQSIKNGESTVEEAFGLLPTRAKHETVQDPLSNSFEPGVARSQPGDAASTPASGVTASPGGDASYSAPISSPDADQGGSDSSQSEPPAPDRFSEVSLQAVKGSFGAMNSGSPWEDCKPVVANEFAIAQQELDSDAKPRLLAIYRRIEQIATGEIDRADGMDIIAGLVGVPAESLT